MEKLLNRLEDLTRELTLLKHGLRTPTQSLRELTQYSVYRGLENRWYEDYGIMYKEDLQYDVNVKLYEEKMTIHELRDEIELLFSDEEYVRVLADDSCVKLDTAYLIARLNDEIKLVREEIVRFG